MKTKTLLGLSFLALSSNAFADNCQLDISVMDAMTYDKPNLVLRPTAFYGFSGS